MAEITNISRTWELGTDGVTYFEVTTTDYDNEEQNRVKKMIGKAGQLAAYYADGFERDAASLAVNARTVALARKSIVEIDNDAQEILAITGIDPLETIKQRYLSELITPGWTIDEGAGFVPIVFSVNAQGNLRYNVNGSGNKNAAMLGPVIRLKSYPAAPTDTEFYIKDNGRRYFSLPNQNVIIKKP